ncbi:hypothetical protein ACFWYW_55950 [Nonomuraea sp. NPDC059023]|uniref:hypothetical protein n=3 Tax=unclassified Nonomuraea TaxID=2593643 RepID=UPI0036A8F79F
MTSNTNAADTAAADSITVEPAHLRGLVDTGPGHVLMWDGRDVLIGPAAMADHGTLLEITTQEEIAATLANDAPGAPPPPGSIADNVTATARLRLEGQRHVRSLMAVSGPYSAALRPYGIHRDQLSHLDPATGDIITRYRTPDGATATLATPYLRDTRASITITIAEAEAEADSGADPAPVYTATVPRRTPPAAVAALIATAAGLTPHTTDLYRHPNDTGFPHTPKQLKVTPAYARALAAHGPGWAIMWNNDHGHPVIACPERGDDGTLLEICRYEEMYTLSPCDTCDDARTCDTCMSGQPDFDGIARNMSDLLGDYHLSIDDIAYCMPGTLPYTRALRAHGYHRHTQGHRYNADHTRTAHHDAYGLDYRSPEGHLVEVIIPINPTPTPADTGAPPLTIRWTYLGHTAPGGTYPTTDLPAETQPTEVAELIAAHLAIHPPTPNTPDTTDDADGTDGADGTGAPDSADTPATA